MNTDRTSKEACGWKHLHIISLRFQPNLSLCLSSAVMKEEEVVRGPSVLASERMHAGGPASR